MTSGALVPDELVVAMVRERITTNPRFRLDGFPRTLAQACPLHAVLERADRALTAAVSLDVPDSVAIDRIQARTDGRDDDDLDTVLQRVEVFRHSTVPVIDHYDAVGLLRPIDAARPVDDVYADLRQFCVARIRPQARDLSPRSASSLLARHHPLALFVSGSRRAPAVTQGWRMDAAVAFIPMRRLAPMRRSITVPPASESRYPKPQVRSAPSVR
jgi:adenylate kinase